MWYFHKCGGCQGSGTRDIHYCNTSHDEGLNTTFWPNSPDTWKRQTRVSHADERVKRRTHLWELCRVKMKFVQTFTATFFSRIGPEKTARQPEPKSNSSVPHGSCCKKKQQKQKNNKNPTIVLYLATDSEFYLCAGSNSNVCGNICTGHLLWNLLF